VFVVSPYWQGRNPEIFNFAKHLADSLSIPFLDFANDTKYNYRDKYFADRVHLNAQGADKFTKDLIIELRKRGMIECQIHHNFAR
jgi:lysophospholipase L1-like esterase